MSCTVMSDDRRALEQVARYLLRAPVSLERMRYDPENARVNIQPLPGEQGGTVELEALEFIARLILHIPDVRERQVRRSGWIRSSRCGRNSPERPQ